MKNIVRNTFEQVTEAGKQIIGGIAEEIKQTLSPGKLFEQLLGIDGSKMPKFESREQMEEYYRKKNSTPLNPEHLHKKYTENEEAKKAALRRKLHKEIKAQEEASLRRKEQEKLRKLRMEEEERRRKEMEERERQQSVLIEPQGKIRRSIFAPVKKIKRTIQQLMPEFRGNKSRG